MPHGMQEVIGSTPIFSTLIKSHLHEVVSGFFYSPCKQFAHKLILELFLII
jgi:hypothetical protein